jgi:hypothetical protein
MRLILSALAAACIAQSASAQTASPDLGRAVDIPVEEWREMAAGRTLTYRIGEELWAFERYAPAGDGVMLQFYDGTCLEGRWDYAAPLYCFHWEGEGTSCFRHARLGEEVLIIETRDGVETGAVQEMTGVSDLPLTCGPAVTS